MLVRATDIWRLDWAADLAAKHTLRHQWANGFSASGCRPEASICPHVGPSSGYLTHGNSLLERTDMGTRPEAVVSATPQSQGGNPSLLSPFTIHMDHPDITLTGGIAQGIRTWGRAHQGPTWRLVTVFVDSSILDYISTWYVYSKTLCFHST